uniref:Uncharacterized protein n=1 Tax=Anguilla anguilla TaxID=7936 RepID=A0A0E9VHW3_ANGAN
MTQNAGMKNRFMIQAMPL